MRAQLRRRPQTPHRPPHRDAAHDWCRGQDSNLRSLAAADLQSAGINHSPTPACPLTPPRAPAEHPSGPPSRRIWSPRGDSNPLTYRLQIGCAAIAPLGRRDTGDAPGLPARAARAQRRRAHPAHEYRNAPEYASSRIPPGCPTRARSSARPAGRPERRCRRWRAPRGSHRKGRSRARSGRPAVAQAAPRWCRQHPSQPARRRSGS